AAWALRSNFGVAAPRRASSHEPNVERTTDNVRAQQTDPPLLHAPLAIVGMACRLPGANSLDEYWQLIATGQQAIQEFPAERLDRALYYSPAKPATGTTYATIGGFVEPDEAAIAAHPHIDPCHATFLAVARQACEHAGLNGHGPRHDRCGVYIGHSAGSQLGGDLSAGTLAAHVADFWRDDAIVQTLPPAERSRLVAELAARFESRRPRRNSRGEPLAEAHQVAHYTAEQLGFEGPRLAIDAACASSLVALSSAALALQSGEIDVALVGGASYNKADSLILFSQAQSCSATDSRPFDAAADGLISSEGYVALVVKTLAQAEADGDTIHAVIRGIGLAADGKGRSLWAPRREGQIAAMNRAYNAQLTPAEIDYVEAHATSTRVGDATELESLIDCFADKTARSSRVPLGSVKANIGHTLETAGLAGLLKVVLAMQRQVIPPTINVTELTPDIDWQRAPFRLPSAAEPWPRRADDQPRRAAVNSFGIGGLNAHVIVEEYAASVAPVTNHESPPLAAVEPIAIVGRGVVLPGAHELSSLRSLIASGEVMLGEPPAGRWRCDAGLDPTGSASHTTPTRRGGYLRNYQYDWRRHKIPPRQIAEANPLQFMLLDAADQALAEAGYHERDYNRQRTAVVVGTTFGGEFSNQLQLGLRLPELERDVRALLQEQGHDEALARRSAEQLRERVLNAWPARRDETGSFTASTLASRLTKTLDLMGGALSLDSGEASSLTALSVACDWLRSGACDQVLCAAGQRSLDLASFELLKPRGWFNADGENTYPAEGAVVVLLKRLADAERDGDRILGVLGPVALASQLESATARVAALTPETPIVTQALVPQIGHLGTAQGLLNVVAATLEFEQVTSPPSLTLVGDEASSGLAGCVAIAPSASRAAAVKPSPTDAPISAQTSATTALPAASVWRFAADSREQLVTQLQAALVDSATAGARAAAKTRFATTDAWRAVIATTGRGSVSHRLKRAIELLQRNDAPGPTRAAGVIVSDPTSRAACRVACVFPGQGSQHPQMLAGLLQSSPALAQWGATADQLLSKHGWPTLAELWGQPESDAADAIVRPQLAMLLADSAMCVALQSLGLQPDAVTGHSFGDFAALIAARVWSLSEALAATQSRAAAVTRYVSDRGALLSTNAPHDWLTTQLRTFGDALVLSHRNAPEQRVVGGVSADIEKLSEAIESAGYAAIPLRVPCAYHTPLLTPAQAPFRAALDSITIEPPRVPFFCGVTGRFVADPAEIRDNLARQLTTPVDYLRQIERMYEHGYRVFVEVGPQRVLSGLNERILADRAVTLLATDDGRGDWTAQFAWLQAALECLGAVNADAGRGASTGEVTPQSASSNGCDDFDATARRRARRVNRPVITPEDEFARRSLYQTKLPTTEPAVNSATPSDELEQFLIDFVVSQTGYPREVVDLDADLEADLGIDSIKRAQLIGELREFVEFTAEDRRNQQQFRTLRLIAAQVRLRSGKTDWLTPADALLATPAPATETTTTTSARPAPPSSDPRAQRLIDFVVEQTGYPPEVVDLDADLEADLGIDSIKRVRLLGELGELFGLKVSGDTRRLAGQLRTLRAFLALLDDSAATTPELLAPEPRVAESPVEPATMPLAAPAEATTSPDTAITSRYLLGLMPRAQRGGAPTTPVYRGAVLIVGDNPIAEALQSRIESRGATVFRLRAGSASTAADELAVMWQQAPILHLFFTTPYDAAAVTTADSQAWAKRRDRGLMLPFLLCQAWLRLLVEHDLAEDASLVGLARLGGSFGFGDPIVATESGALAGLLKAILIENWVAGNHELTTKLLDFVEGTDPAEIAALTERELAVPSYDNEVAWRDGERHVVIASPAPLAEPGSHAPRRGAVWVCTGGARGITAVAARELAKRFGIKLRLVGTTPLVDLDDSLPPAVNGTLTARRAAVMRLARNTGRNPIDAWRDDEKVREIQQTLAELRRDGIDAEYYVADVADREQMSRVLDTIRRLDGPIAGVLHGAGIGQDARFDHKQLKKVEQCFRAKIDGAAVLIDLTQHDPLTHFIAFGSISGRLGANGHTDYSAANEMLAKQMGWLRRARPEVAATLFHWHAWGDVGMATKPETRLALEMIGMQLMPAAEGIEHLVRELRAGCEQTEVVITDDRYHRMFCHYDRIVSPTAVAPSQLPLLPQLETHAGSQYAVAKLEPLVDPFLVEHRLDDRPILPFVVALEMLAEGGQLAGLGRVVELRDVSLTHGLRFFTDRAQTAKVAINAQADTTVECRLLADMHTRQGRLVTADRECVRGVVSSGGSIAPPTLSLPTFANLGIVSERVRYAPAGASFYLGPAMRALKRIAVVEREAWGELIAPALSELAGMQRAVDGWIVPSALVDGCLYAAGLLAWQALGSRSTLPAGIGRLTLFRQPDTGEACRVHVRLTGSDDAPSFDFDVFGCNGEAILSACDYRVTQMQVERGWAANESAAS
ncbi:MAG: SDR family NAD(P)-dependent oxidoreductase, partial [Planctomycetaceae bacterium]|nr:SDR family NAD(P)-dependent oxidoreductase [Planctomycetaceae bacterium]